MDPMSWRLPSGKALAEFALQSGFLVPPMLGRMMIGSSMGDGRIRRATRTAKPNGLKKTGEAPVSSGNFREDGIGPAAAGEAGPAAGQIGAGQVGAGQRG
jgi:hypothetical protein